MSQQFHGPYDNGGPSHPGVFQQPSTSPGGQPTVRPRRRRSVHISTAMTLLLGIPWLLASLVVVTMVVSIAGGGDTAIFIAWGVFLASGFLVFLRPTEDLVARLVFRLRTPNSQEQARLQTVWGSVTQAAGINAAKYRLWVQESDDINAMATAGHIVAVTRVALNSLPPNHLAGVLAHELGHHLGGHAWARLMTYWYSLPGRLLLRVWFWFSYVVFGLFTGVAAGTAMGLGGRGTATAAGCLVGPILRLFPILFVLMLAWMLYSIHPATLLVFLIPVVLSWFNRLAEKHADKVAAQLGFGPALVEVLYGWINAGHDAARMQQGWRALIFASHPSCASRVRTLERRLYGRSAT